MTMLKNFGVALVFILIAQITATSQPLRVYLYDNLKVTDKQRAEIDKLIDEYQKTMIDLRSELKKLYIDMKSEWKSSKPDKRKLESLQDKINDIRNKMSKQRLNHWFDIYNLLDETQKEKFRELRSEFFSKFLDRPLLQKERIKIKKRFPGKGLGPCGEGFGPGWFWFYDDK